MTTLTKQQLITEAQAIYEGCAPDMGEFDLEMAADFVAGHMYDDDFVAGREPIEGGYYQIALEALKDYF